MKIQSNFKDYYDHIAHVHYGGGDPKLIYNRVPFKGNCAFSDLLILPGSGNLPLGEFSSYWVSVAGYLFMVERGKIVNPDTHVDLYRKCYKHWGTANGELTGIDFYRGNDVYPQELLKVSREIQAPVWQFRVMPVGGRQRKLYINTQIPNLGKIGLAAYVKPENLYQSIAQYLELLRPVVPDNPIPDKLRVEAHGFNHQSFRHPVK
jgi:hypothetical protein